MTWTGEWQRPAHFCNQCTVHISATSVSQASLETWYAMLFINNFLAEHSFLGCSQIFSLLCTLQFELDIPQVPYRLHTLWSRIIFWYNFFHPTNFVFFFFLISLFQFFPHPFARKTRKNPQALNWMIFSWNSNCVYKSGF